MARIDRSWIDEAAPYWHDRFHQHRVAAAHYRFTRLQYRGQTASIYLPTYSKNKTHAPLELHPALYLELSEVSVFSGTCTVL